MVISGVKRSLEGYCMRDEARYDRQLRLWGDEGQACLERASVCMLGSSALGCEILKSLVLAGIKSIYIVDSERIVNADFGNNFFVQGEIGHSRAKATLKLLLVSEATIKSVCAEILCSIVISALYDIEGK